MRKTFEVEKLKDKVNGMLRDLPDTDTSAREVLQTIVENVLMDTGNYRGFQYLDARDMNESKNGTTVGIRENADIGLRFENTDRTRVKYF